MKKKFIDFKQNILFQEEFEKITESPFCYFIVQQITTGDVSSVSQVKELVSFRKDLQDKVSAVLSVLESMNIIEVDNDKIIKKKGQLRYDLKKSADGELFPFLFHIAAKRAIRNIDLGNHEMVLFNVSDDDQTSDEIKLLIEEFRVKMRQIGVRSQARIATGTKLVGILNTPMIGHDFLSYETTSLSQDNDAFKQKVSKASHDIKPIIKALETISDDVKSNCPVEICEIYKTLIERLDDIANVFLPSKSKPTDPIAFDVLAVCDLLAIEKKKVWKNKVNIRVFYETQNVRIDNLSKADFERVMSNLIDNAAQAVLIENIPDTKKIIDLSINTVENKLILKIQDSGQGMSPEFVNKVEQNVSFTTKTDGNGIGLASSKALIESAGGQFELKSELGHGTTIAITMPLVECLNTDKLQKTHIVLVDDDPLVRLIWKKKVNPEKYMLTICQSGRELMEKVSHHGTQDIVFYIDSNLGNHEKGELLAKKLSEMGYSHLYMNTGEDSEQFIAMPWIKGVINKQIPIELTE